MAKSTMRCAGIDTGKRQLDAALGGGDERLQVDNGPAGHARLSGWLRRHRVERVGIEASGGYEGAVVAQLRRDGFVVVVFQPAQVRAYARFVLRRAKNDRLDAALIATCTAAANRIPTPADPRLTALAGHLTMLDQLGQDIACLKNRRESCRDPRIGQHWKAEIARLKAVRRAELKELAAAIRRHPDLAARLDLLASIDGVGLPTAIAIPGFRRGRLWCACPRSANSAGNRPVPSPGWRPTMTTAASGRAGAISRVAASGCATPSTPPPSPPPFTGTISSNAATGASSAPASRTRWRSSPAPESC